MSKLRITNYELRITALISGLLLLLTLCIHAQEITLRKIEPPFWWTGFKEKSLQLMVYGKDIASCDVTISYPGVLVEKVNRGSTLNYLFVDITISPETKPGKFELVFSNKDQQTLRYPYELRSRKKGSADRQGFSSADVIYLLMPDRFSNGDPSKDSIAGMKQGVNRKDPEARHGGDIRGIMNHLDYFREMGFTALWLNPLVENDMSKYSYHGYSITDFYRIDPRLGTNDDYLVLSESIHKKGMKLIMDMIMNHCGSEHPWMEDLPFHDWIHQFPEYTNTSYRAETLTDPYVSRNDSIRFINGWFSKLQPDLNHKNRFLARYLIQNSIWWIEYAGLDGIRMDTYLYADRYFMSEWDKAILKEYPHINIVGECWNTTPESIAYWQKDSKNSDGYNSHLPSVFDFAMYDALQVAFKEKEGWHTGNLRISKLLSKDFIYPDPSNIVVFADNHDVDRYLASQEQDIRKLKMAMAFILTSRGIPQIYYGTEILMTTGKDKRYEDFRKDFPGGWPGDTVNAFTGKGLTADQADMQQFLKALVNWRKSKEVIHAGQLKHFLPEEGLYVYFRHNENDTVMVVINNNDTIAKTLKPGRYGELLGDVVSATDVVTGQLITDLPAYQFPAKSATVLELKIKN